MRGGAFDIRRIAPHLEELHARLSGVTIECLHYADFIVRYDRPATLFYLDPPYLGYEKEYEGSFKREDFERLASVLSGVKGRFIMSLNYNPILRKCFAAFSITTVDARYTAGGTKNAKLVKELLITAGGAAVN
ncbi:MAG: DNA adenine methylase [Candidatus Binatus sp.]|uniref:DNA adenine methylase n=1 Tax=Candidatus Binatus sp. TaxID=2811406 RepID=UPI0027190044|nr:DNA adenine methylase [Candidatus Binatus sp.]MDO8433840.1 DNA adenine methylase [Candidatus Binatus sp.]